MRIEIAGAQITDVVVEILDTLQNDRQIIQLYTDTIDRLTRTMIIEISGDDVADTEIISHLRALQMIRRDLISFAIPPDADNADNDIPTVSL